MISCRDLMAGSAPRAHTHLRERRLVPIAEEVRGKLARARAGGVIVSGGTLLAVMLVIAGCSRSPPARTSDRSIVVMPVKDPSAARSLIASGAVVIDVRTADEHAGDHLPKAVNIPIQALPARLVEVDALVAGDKTRPIVVYCATGRRAAKAKQLLEEAGYSHVVNGGGFDDLRELATENAR